ncbi:MAG: hypothetical protein ACLTM8_00595 [Veillonella parvula]
MRKQTKLVAVLSAAALLADRCIHDFLRSCWMAGRKWYMGIL